MILDTFSCTFGPFIYLRGVSASLLPISKKMDYLPLVSWDSLYTLDINLLSDICTVNIFSPILVTYSYC